MNDSRKCDLLKAEVAAVDMELQTLQADFDEVEIERNQLKAELERVRADVERDKRAAVHGCYCEEDSPAPGEGPGHFVECARGKLEAELGVLQRKLITQDAEREEEVTTLKADLAEAEYELQNVQADYGEVEAERDQLKADLAAIEKSASDCKVCQHTAARADRMGKECDQLKADLAKANQRAKGAEMCIDEDREVAANDKAAIEGKRARLAGDLLASNDRLDQLKKAVAPLAALADLLDLWVGPPEDSSVIIVKRHGEKAVYVTMGDCRVARQALEGK